MFLLKGFFNLCEVALGQFLGLGRELVVLVRPGAKIEHLAAFGAEGAKFVILEFRFASAMWAFD